MKCYRVWFKDGSAVLVDAEDDRGVREEIRRLGLPEALMARIECLSEPKAK